jgi:hypothetical protein
MRVLAPKVHVEVFRPTLEPEYLRSGERSGIRINPRHKPNELRYIRVANVEDRRIKGVQFEETALFGGFIEINIAEDPQSHLFDRFLPNDHVEVFYNDTSERTEKFGVLTGLNADGDYNYSDYRPKFQGASWKTDLKYRPTMVTTQLHAWDYLRLLQYINIPRGEQEKQRATTIVAPPQKAGEAAKLMAKGQKQRFGDDFLDYVDSAVHTFIDDFRNVSIFGQGRLNVEFNDEGISESGLKFVSTKNEDSRVKFRKAGIGLHCNNRLAANARYKEFEDVRNWSYDLNEIDKAIEKVSNAIDEMEQYDILQFRFIDGLFIRFKGFEGSNLEEDPLVELYSTTANDHYTADIIAISQFALIELLLKKLTVDHGLNQWFTPLIKYDKDFLKELGLLGESVGKKVSKLIYIRLSQVHKDESETTRVAFNIDTYPFVEKFATDAFKLMAGNIVRTMKGDGSQITVDIFTEILGSLDFPQSTVQKGLVGNTFSLYPLVQDFVTDPSKSLFESHKQAYEDLMQRFDVNFTPSAEFEEQSFPYFSEKLSERITNWASFIQKILFKDDKIISYIKSVPASYMRADIYTGSKFNTLQYDSLAITRIIQLIASNMAGFPATNNPISNTEKGKIDSYPIFAANRIVIRPRAYFGKRADSFGNEFVYNIYPSLAHLAKNKNEANATCFLILEVGRKKLKGKEEKPEFEFPIEDIQDYGMIKASTVNHFFNFSLADHWKDFKLIQDIGREDPNAIVYKNTTANGFFLEYREGNILSVGFSPPEHQHLKLEDLVQSHDYDSWRPRFIANTNVSSLDESKPTSKPIYHPKTAYTIRKSKAGLAEETNRYLINDYDSFESFEVRIEEKQDSPTTMFYPDGTTPVDPGEVTIEPWHGITGYIDISDLKAEFAALELIMTGDASYRDITNVDQNLMDNIWIRAPLEFEVRLFKGNKYNDKIRFIRPGEGEGARKPKVFEEKRLSTLIKDINIELDKISEIDMMWLFPYSGFEIKDNGKITSLTLEKEGGVRLTELPETTRKHLFLITYLDLLVKGIRYLLWSMAKARFFAHVYIPIEYQKYAKRVPSEGNLDLRASVVEPGSSVQITYNDENTLFKTIDEPLVSFPIEGLNSDTHLPLFNSITRSDIANTEEDKYNRSMTWYVSKKVTYLGADTGAMMRVEMTEGSLDWTLFYNEKNLLTQVSEHYFLNGLGNFRRSGLF